MQPICLKIKIETVCIINKEGRQNSNTSTKKKVLDYIPC